MKKVDEIKKERVAKDLMALIFLIDMADSYRMEIESADSGYRFARHELRQALLAMSRNVKLAQKHLFSDYAESLRGIIGDEADFSGERNDARRDCVDLLFEYLGHSVPENRVKTVKNYLNNLILRGK